MARLKAFAGSLVSWLAVLAAIALVQGILTRALQDHGRPPELLGLKVDGARFAGLDALPKPAVIYFWASWCGICKAMQGTVAGLAAEIPVITVATQSGDRSEVADYQRQSQFNVPTLLDEHGESARNYGLRGVPAFFIIGRDGTIRFATTGLTSAWGIRLRLWLAGQ